MSEDEGYEKLTFGDVIVAVLFLCMALSGGLGIDGKVSMSEDEISSKDGVERAVGGVEIGRVINPVKQLECPTLNFLDGGFGTGPLPPFLIFLLRGGFAVAVLSEVGLDCVGMNEKEDFCLELEKLCFEIEEEVGMPMAQRLREADFQDLFTAFVSFLSSTVVDRSSTEVVESVPWLNGKLLSLYSGSSASVPFPE